jgi:hypothetical protein
MLDILLDKDSFLLFQWRIQEMFLLREEEIDLRQGDVIVQDQDLQREEEILDLQEGRDHDRDRDMEGIEIMIVTGRDLMNQA